MNPTTKRVKRGDVFRVGKKLYAVCIYCGSVIRINKPLIGGVHVCNLIGEDHG